MKIIPLVDLFAQYKTIRKEINQAIKHVIATSSYIMGENVYKFEEEFAQYLGIKYCIGVSSGTDALHLSLLALGVKPGDEVITSPFTFFATAEAISMCGAKPVFVEIDEKTYNIDPNKIKDKITQKTKGIIPVHLYGQPADMNAIMEIAKNHKLFVLEDCAQAHGAEIKINNSWRKVGTIGDVGIFSFYPAKNLGCYGDGGAVVTNNQDTAEKVRLLRNHGRLEKYEHKILGYGCRLDTIQAAILRVKLEYLDRWNRSRREIANLYNKLLKDLPVVTPFESAWAKSVYHLYAIRVKERYKLKEKLRKKRIETGIHYPVPLHLQPAYKHLGYQKGDYPKAEEMAHEELSLPLYPELSQNQIYYIVTAIKQFYEENTHHY